MARKTTPVKASAPKGRSPKSAAAITGAGTKNAPASVAGGAIKTAVAGGEALETMAEEFVRETSGVAEETLEMASEQLESMREAMRQVAESGLEQSRAAFEQLRAAADEASASFEASSEEARAALGKMGALMMENVQLIPAAALDLAGSLAKTGNPAEAFSICHDHGRVQIEAIAKRNEELMEAGQSYIRALYGPIVGSYSKSFST